MYWWFTNWAHANTHPRDSFYIFDAFDNILNNLSLHSTKSFGTSMLGTNQHHLRLYCPKRTFEIIIWSEPSRSHSCVTSSSSRRRSHATIVRQRLNSRYPQGNCLWISAIHASMPWWYCRILFFASSTGIIQDSVIKAWMSILGNNHYYFATNSKWML